MNLEDNKQKQATIQKVRFFVYTFCREDKTECILACH